MDRDKDAGKRDETLDRPAQNQCETAKGRNDTVKILNREQNSKVSHNSAKMTVEIRPWLTLGDRQPET